MSKDFELLNSFERSDSLCSPSPQVKLLNLLLSGNVEKFVEVLKNNLGSVDVNYFYEEPENGTLLDIACRSRGNRKFVDVLIQYGADVNAPNSVFDKYPLQVAVEKSDTETLDALVKCLKCNINALDKFGNTVLHIAAKLNKVNFIEILLKHPNIDINAVNRKHQTPLHLALTEGSKEAIRVLLATPDVDLDEVKDFRDRSCREIIEEKYPEFKMDMHTMGPEKGLNQSMFIFLRNRDVRSFLRLAKVNKHCLNDNDGTYTYLQFACAHGMGEVTDTLLNIGVDPNGCCPHNGKPPLILAAERGYHDIVLRLIQNSETTLYPAGGTTALHAVMNGMYNTDKNLQSNSADCNYRKCLENILKEASREQLEQLDLNFRDDSGSTALHYAAQLNDDDTVRALLEAGAYVGHKNNNGTMALEWIDPKVLEEYLDRCISTNDKAAREQSYEIIYNYKILAPPRKQSYYEKHDSEIDEKEIYDIISETEPLLVMNSIPELRRLLTHPVLTSFLNLKWYTIRKYFFINLVFYLTFWISLTSYILYTYGFSNTRNSTSNATAPVAAAGDGSNPYVPVNDTLLWYITLMLCGVLFLREFFQFIISPWPYVKSPENWLEMGLICISGAVLVCQTDLDERPQLAAIAILASWMELILLIGRHPLLSTNIEMFKTVSLNFLKFLAWYSILILAFAFSFYILFNDRAGEDDIFFRNPAMSVFKSVIMLTGEFDAGSIPFGEKISTSHLLFILFVFLVAIVLFNLLNGLAVSDTQAIRADAELVGIVSRVKLISYVEKIAVSDPFPCLSFTDKLACCCCCAPLKQVTRRRERHVKMFYKRINLFPHTLADDQVRVRPNEGNTMVMSDAITKYRDDDACFVRCADWRIDPNIIKDTNKVLEKYRKQNEALNFTELIKEYTEQLREYKMKLDTVESASERNEKLLKEIMGVLKQRL
ncbi:transient receptor potential cation channel protein painless-like [Planococcus citri]|uniref:transient receptor potential cation channel protein painless-like n=1 Tax=Planococcus citri TaxID=170843 RepID=UPI0031F81F89